MSWKNNRLLNVTIIFSSLLFLSEAVSADDEKELVILKYMIASGGQAIIYNNDLKFEKAVDPDELPVPPVQIMEQAKNGRLYKIAEDLWLRSTSVRTNKTATITPSIEILNKKQLRGQESDGTTPGTRGLRSK